MAKVTRTDATTRSASTTDTTARQRAIIAAEKAKSAAAMDAAKKEETARNADITVVATSYDATTGDWVASTPDGGTVRAQSLTNGSLSGLRLPLQRFPGSQTARINAPPTDADIGWVVAELEAIQRDMVQVLAVQVQDRDPEGVADARYPGDKWLNNTSNSLFIWDAENQNWALISGGEILVLDAPPAEPPDGSNALAFVRDPKETYVWDADAATPAWLGPYGGGGIKHILSSQTTDNEVDPSILNPGDLFTNEGSKRLYFYTGAAWVLYPWAVCDTDPPCADPDPPPHAPGVVCTFTYVGTTGTLPGPDYPCFDSEGNLHTPTFACLETGWAWVCG